MAGENAGRVAAVTSLAAFRIGIAEEGWFCLRHALL
jgi:hypothetical protein